MTLRHQPLLETLVARALIVGGLLVAASGCRPEPQLDVKIIGAMVIDGTGAAIQQFDVGVLGDRITEVGQLADRAARHEIDATGLYLAPGFIDTHSHSAQGLATSGRSDARGLLTQGITTVVVNPDGDGPVDLEKQQRALLEHGLGVNVAQMIGHGAIRRQVLGMENRAPDEGELEAMLELARTAMAVGAVGVSSGPFYAPGSYSTTNELVAVAAIAAESSGIYQSHIRDESDYSVGLEAAVAEVIEVAERNRMTGIVTHIKALGPPVWGMSGTIIENINAARERGVSVFADQYPYPASATGLGAALLPRWAQAGGRDRFLERLTDPAMKAKIKEAMAINLVRRGGAERIQFRSFREDTSIEGRTLHELATEQNKDPIVVALDLLERSEAGEVGIVSFNMDERDIEAFMRQPWTMTASDGSYPIWEVGVPHPRAFGTFPRRLREYNIDKQVLSLEDTIHSMTSLPAEVFGFTDRGVVREGAIADLVLFDLETIRDRATFERPFQLSEGVVAVLVNGTPAIEDSTVTDTLAGRIVSRY